MRQRERLGAAWSGLALALLVLAAGAWGQSGKSDAATDAGGDDLDAMFDEAVIEDEAGDGDGADAEDGDLDALFESEVVANDAAAGAEPVPPAAPEAGLLTGAGVDWGGSFRYDATVELAFAGYEELATALQGDGAAARTLRHDVGAVLYLDARPDRDFRVFAKGKADFASAERDQPPEFAFTPFELFADFHWDDRVFFRAGKQRADWGVGRFFSPADLISLVTIDPLDPDAEREGPVALKVHAPLGVHNGYLYLITDDYTDPLDVAVGARGEVVVGAVELGFGGLLQAALVPKAIATATGALGDFDLFGELVVQRGTERNLIELDERGGVKVTDRAERDREWFPAMTVGGSYLNGDLNLVLAAQYYYNPLGYSDSAALGPARRCLKGGNGAQDAPRCPKAPGPEPQAVDLVYFGRHYAGANATWSDIARSDLSASLSWLGNLSDGSGLLRPSLSYQVLEHIKVTLGASLGYAATPDAAQFRDSVAFTLGVSLGAGSF